MVEMSTISVSDVKKLAKLSALHVSDDEVATLQAELNHILEYVEQLNSVNTDGVEPTYQVTGLASVTRADTIIDYGVTNEDLLKNAPSAQNGQIKVPRVIE